jgi:two-component system, OmpR family, sensor histidine kinase KdpD
MVSEVRRPDPDELLAQVRSEEQQKRRGRLKLFLGYAAGVGKTYAMLEAAHQRKEEGVDVVVGYVETHGRAETEAMLAGLEVVPRCSVEYHGAVLPEMDLDAVLARHPQLVLVDELAHTNAPGCRHAKRYLDVEELLDAGIAVYTTLNIQHLESLNDVVARITGVTVREKLPDGVFDEADEIELVDLPPPELVQRLQEGKVYVPDQAAQAVHQFFRLGNLTALREVAMRRAAERVDFQMRAYMRTRAIRGPWPASERLLVCISPGPNGERLIHAGRRLANHLGAEWFALYVETPDAARLSEAARTRVAHYLQLAQELGARIRTLPADSVAESVVAYARKHNVTKIIAGKPLRSRWSEILTGSVVDRIIRESHDIDVFVINSPQPSARPDEVSHLRPHAPAWRYLASLGIVAAVTLLAQPLASTISPTNLVMLYLTAVVIAAVYLGRGPALLASFTGVLAFDYLFVPPQLTFAVADTQYLLTFVGLLLVGFVISSLMARVRSQADAAQRREAQAVELAELSRDLAGAGAQDEIIQVVLGHVSETFGREAAVLLPQADSLQVHAAGPDFTLDTNELAVADWSFKHGQPAGRGTATLPAAQIRYLPLKTARGVVGVLGIRPAAANQFMAPEQRRLLEVFASQAALAIERAQLAEHARQAQLLQATEKLQSALLNSISHELRTPLVAITGAFSTLKSDDDNLDDAMRRSLIADGQEEAERLNRLVGNLLDMTRIEAGALRLRYEPAELQDIAGTALERLSARLEGRPVFVQVSSASQTIQVDLVLVVQALVNLIDNAIKYSPPGSPIEVRGQETDGVVEISVWDRGSGVAPEDLVHIFDKFYRVRQPDAVHRPDNVGGTGLGLSISKGIIEAHGGRIWAENRPGGGTVLRFTLPVHSPQLAA